MKRISIILIISIILTSFTGGINFTMAVSEPTPESMLSDGTSPITGTFIQPWLYNRYSEERWEKEFAFMKELGIEYIIVGDTLTIETGNPITDKSKWKITAYYPTQNSDFVKGTDCLTNIFEKCRKYGIKLYVGMGNTSNGWSFLDLNTTGFKEIGEQFAVVAEDIYNVFYESYKDVFAGFYFVPEMYNSSNFDNEYTRTVYVNNLANGFKPIFDKLNELNPSLPFIFSPYVNMFGGSWVSKNPDNIGKFWKELLEKAGFRDGDILCPQDSVGAGGNNLEHLEEVTRAYYYATNNCGKDIHLWTNAEIFIQPVDKFFDDYDGYGNYWSTCTIDRMVEQFKIVSDYVERIFVFAVPHYLSPYNTVSGYYDAYKYYLEHGEVEKVAPIAPDTFRTLRTVNSGKSSLSISWSGMYDNIGIHRVNIYKNGKFFTYRNATRNEGTDVSPIYPNSFIDLDYDFDTDKPVKYEFEVIDCSGNVSERVSFTVEPGSVPNQAKLSRTYTGPKAYIEGARAGIEAAKK